MFSVFIKHKILTINKGLQFLLYTLWTGYAVLIIWTLAGDFNIRVKVEKPETGTLWPRNHIHMVSTYQGWSLEFHNH